jgi:predicted transcriptional regulator
MTPTTLDGAEIACDSARPPISERETARTILGLLLSEPHSWTRVEIARELGGQEIATHDAVENLVRAGLANREGEAISASRAARVFEELEP